MASTASTRAVPLYRALLRAHKKYLPMEMRELGDVYVKQEFRLHKSAKPEFVDSFLAEWESYLQQLQQTARAQQSRAAGSLEDTGKEGSSRVVFEFGQDLPHNLDLTDEQLTQLEKLRDEASKIPVPKDS